MQNSWRKFTNHESCISGFGKPLFNTTICSCLHWTKEWKKRSLIRKKNSDDLQTFNDSKYLGVMCTNNAFPYPLVDDDTKGMFRNVENASSLAMIGLVGHTLLEGSVTLKKSEIKYEWFYWANVNFYWLILLKSSSWIKLRLSSNRFFTQHLR